MFEEFDYMGEYKPRLINLQADHLSTLSKKKMGESPEDDRLVDDNIFVVTAKSDWYASIVEFLTTQKLAKDWTKEERRKIRVNTRCFVVLENMLFRRGLLWLG